MKNRETWLMEEDGVTATCVPLNKDSANGSAFVDPADYDVLIAKGVSGNWYQMSGGQVGVAVRGKNTLVARLLLDLGPQQVVEYRNGNARDLRRSNLEVRASTGAWKPKVIVNTEPPVGASDARQWIKWTGSEIAGQNAFNARSVPIKRRAPARLRR